MRKLREVKNVVVSLIVFVLLWQILFITSDFNENLFPSPYKTTVVTTSESARLPGAERYEYDHHHANISETKELAEKIVRRAIESFEVRKGIPVYIPPYEVEAEVGFSVEYIHKRFGSMKPLADAIKSGQILGVVNMVGCNNPKVLYEKCIVDVADVLLQNNEDFFQIKFKYNFFCFVKHAFTNNEIISSKYLAKQALNISSYLNMTLLIKEKIKLTPIIVVKIKEYIDSAKIYSPKKLLQDITVLFSDFSENFKYDLKQVNIPLFRSIIINLIFYGLEVTDVQIPFDFLIYTLYAVKDMGNKNDNLE